MMWQHVRCAVFSVVFGVTSVMGILSFHPFPLAASFAFACPRLYRVLVDHLIGYYLVFLAVSVGSNRYWFLDSLVRFSMAYLAGTFSILFVDEPSAVHRTRFF